MQTNFARAIYRAFSDMNITQAELSRRSGLTQPTISKLISDNRRPDTATLRALCNAWNDAEFELGLLCEHLRDEIGRAGKRESDIALHPTSTPKPTHTQLDEDLELIRNEAIKQQDMKYLIADMAAIVRRHRSRTHLDIAAEDRPGYGN